jgi:hypothetical protein
VTLVAVIVVPATLATVLVLSMLGMSFNIMTLGGIAAAVGLLIDDVIVMVEHIARRAGETRRTATWPAMRSHPGRARVHGTADRVEHCDADRLRSAVIPDRRDRRLLQGAVGDDGGSTRHFLGNDRLSSYRSSCAGWWISALARPRCRRRGRLAVIHDKGLNRLSARPWLLRVIFVPLLAVAISAIPRCRRLHAEGR